MRLQGRSYQEIAAAGGGILKTVSATRAAGADALYSATRERLIRMLSLGVTTVELRIDQGHTASQHVAENAGFIRAGTVTQYVPGTGQTFEDLRYVLERQPEP